MNRQRQARLAIAALLILAPFCVTQSAELEQLKTRSSDGLEIAYVEGGSGPLTLVFVHGWTCDHSYWSEQLPVFAQDYHVLALDLAGHGASELGRAHYSMESFGADVAAVADGDGPVVLVGHSMGGPVILQAALLLGDRVQGLVAVDTLKDVVPPITSHEELEARLEPLQKDYVATAEQFLAMMFLETSDPQLQREITRDMLATDPVVGVDATRGILRSDFAAALEAIDVPLVIINSSYRPTNLEAVKNRHPDTTLEIMDGVGHFVMLEDPATFNALLRKAVESFR